MQHEGELNTEPDNDRVPRPVVRVYNSDRALQWECQELDRASWAGPLRAEGHF